MKQKEESEMELTYRKAAQSDADLMKGIYNASFYEDYARYGECPDYGRTKGQKPIGKIVCAGTANKKELPKQTIKKIERCMK